MSEATTPRLCAPYAAPDWTIIPVDDQNADAALELLYRFFNEEDFIGDRPFRQTSTRYGMRRITGRQLRSKKGGQ